MKWLFLTYDISQSPLGTALSTALLHQATQTISRALNLLTFSQPSSDGLRVKSLVFCFQIVKLCASHLTLALGVPELGARQGVIRQGPGLGKGARITRGSRRQAFPRDLGVRPNSVTGFTPFLEH